MAYATVTLSGTYQTPDGTPHKGHVEIIPSERVIKDTTGDIILTGRVKVDLDAQGAFSVVLPATDDPGLNPTGFGYTIAAKLHSSHPPAVSFTLPASLGATTVEDLTPVDPSTFAPTTTYAESSEVAALDVRVTSLEDTPPVTSYNDLTDKPAIPSAPGDIGAEPAGLSAETEAALAATYARKVERARPFGPVRTLATGQHNGFAHAVTAANGDVVVCWRNGANHTPSKGVIQTMRFRDDLTLNAVNAAAITDPTYDLRDPCLTLLSDDRLAMSFFAYDQATEKALVDGVRVSFSSDNGATWTAPVVVGSAFTDGTQAAAPVVELNDGTLLLPTYGRSAGQSHQEAHVSRSTDGGATWTHHGVIAAAQGSRHYQEPNIVITERGDLLAMVRSEPAPYEIVSSRSTDGGATWTAPVVEFAGSASTRLTTQAGFLYAMYRNSTTGRTMVRSSGDSGTTWGDATELPYPSGKPSSAYGVALPFRSDSLRYFYSVQSADTLTADVVRVDAIVPEDRDSRGATGCRARPSGYPQIASGVISTVALDTEDADTHGFHTTTGDTSRLSVPAGMGGYYLVTASAMFTANATGRRQVRIVKNGGSPYLAVNDVPANAAGETSVSASAAFVYLAEGDYVQIQVYQDSGGNLNMRPEGTHFALALQAAPI